MQFILFSSISCHHFNSHEASCATASRFEVIDELKKQPEPHRRKSSDYSEETRILIPSQLLEEKMTAKYDENLLENNYFKALRNKRTDLWKDAVKRKLWVGIDISRAPSQKVISPLFFIFNF